MPVLQQLSAANAGRSSHLMVRLKRYSDTKAFSDENQAFGSRLTDDLNTFNVLHLRALVSSGFKSRGITGRLLQKCSSLEFKGFQLGPEFVLVPSHNRANA